MAPPVSKTIPDILPFILSPVILITVPNGNFDLAAARILNSPKSSSRYVVVIVSNPALVLLATLYPDAVIPIQPAQSGPYAVIVPVNVSIASLSLKSFK